MNKMKFRMTWSMYSRISAFNAGVFLMLTPVTAWQFLMTGHLYYLWLSAVNLSTFWIMLYLSHVYNKKEEEHRG